MASVTEESSRDNSRGSSSSSVADSRTGQCSHPAEIELGNSCVCVVDYGVLADGARRRFIRGSTKLESGIAARTAIVSSFRRDTRQYHPRLLAPLAQAQLVSCFVLCLPLETYILTDEIYRSYIVDS